MTDSERIAAHARWVARDPGGVRADLCRHAFRGQALDGAVLDEAVLRDADFTGASLREASLVRADLRFASLRGADLRAANLSGALLDFASLAGADLSGARLLGASLAVTDLDDIRMSWFDPTLVSERLWRAAGNDLELRMVAAYVGHTTARCWDDHRDLPPRYRRWMLSEFLRWQRPGDEAPPLLAAIAVSALPAGSRASG